MIPIDHKVMTFWFHGDGFANSGNHVFAIAVGLAEVVGILLPKAHVQNTRACQAHPVAAFAKIMAHRCD